MIPLDGDEDICRDGDDDPEIGSAGERGGRRLSKIRTDIFLSFVLLYRKALEFTPL